MAVLIDIRKLADEDTHTDYTFSVAEASEAGILRIDKETGDVSLIRPMTGAATADAHFHRAAHKIRQHWKRGNLPETAVWAS